MHPPSEAWGDTASLAELMTPAPLEAGRFGARIPDGWQQGRGAFGGLVLGLLTRALEAETADPGRRLRSLTAEICGPALPGAAEIRTRMLRRGSGVSTVAAELLQGGETQAHAVGVLGRARRTRQSMLRLAPPSRPDWREVEPLPFNGPEAARFARHFEYRALGPAPYSGHSEPEALGWIRPRNPGAPRDAAWVVACLDAWWPALLATHVEPRPMATIGFTCELVAEPASLDPEAPLLHAARVAVAEDGYCVEFRELWDAAGRLVALNQQTFAVLG